MSQKRDYIDIYSHTGGIKHSKEEQNNRTKKSRWILKSVLCFLVILCSCVATVLAYIAGAYVSRLEGNASEPPSLNTANNIADKSSNGEIENNISSAVDSVIGVCVYNGEIGTFASGVIISTDGYIITNDHVFSGINSPSIKVYDKFGQYYDAAFIGADSKYDIAVIKIEKLGLTAAKIGNGITVGEKIYCIGCPMDSTLSLSVTQGIVSGLDRRVGSLINEYSPRMIQTDAAINPGNSGGAIINQSGQVVGISCSKVSDDDYEGIGFAVPIFDAVNIANELIENGSIVGRAKLGISYSCVNYGQSLISGKSCGIVINSIDILSDLYGKGFGKGDTITTVNGQKIRCEDDFLTVIEGSKPNDKITLTIITQSGMSREAEVVLMEEKPNFSYRG